MTSLLASVLVVQAPLTLPAFVDDLTARHGYGVVGTSAVEMRPVEVPDLGKSLDVEVRLKNRWRVARDGTMPGVWRPLVGPYHEIFEEQSGRMTVRGGPRGVVIEKPEPKEAPLPVVKREELFQPGGVRIDVAQLAGLLKVRKEDVPWYALRRTVRIRLDERRMPEPLSLIAAIAGGTIAVDGTIAFDPKTFRPLAVATLRAEAAKGVRTRGEDEFEGDVDPFLKYEARRPFRLALGAAAFVAATETELLWMFAGPNRSGTVKGVNVEDLFPGEVQRTYDAFMAELSEQSIYAEVKKRFPDASRPQVGLSSSQGTGSLRVLSPDGKTALGLD